MNPRQVALACLAGLLLSGLPVQPAAATSNYLQAELYLRQLTTDLTQYSGFSLRVR
ncbi:MAG: hypothetical protein AAF152_17210 [Cyanobacteria bacterium P01_A01_bin.114]